MKLRSIFSVLLLAALTFTDPAYGGTWKQEGARYRYIEQGASVRSRWIQDTDGRWYYLNADGYMQTGWFRDGMHKWYQLGTDGAMKTGWWKDINGKWYYFGADGSMYIHQNTPDGYRVGEDGAYIEVRSKLGTQAVGGGYLDLDAIQEIYLLVNKERLKNGLGILQVNAELQKAANIRAMEIVQSFTHTRPNGARSFTAIDKNSGLWYSWISENIAYGQENAGLVMSAWMQSDGHKRNILQAEANFMGAACYVKDGVRYWTQMFAHLE